VATTNRQLIVLENNLGELSLSDDDEDTESEENKAAVQKQLEEGKKALDSSLKLLTELLSKAQEDAVAKAAGGDQSHHTTIFGDNNSGSQVGVVYGSVTNTFGGK
jgi:hypothetical protein